MFYELAIAVGKSLDLKEMLKHALIAYLRKLNCVSAIVFQVKPDDEVDYINELVFSIPIAPKVQKIYQKVLNVLPNSFSKLDLDNYRKRLSILGSEGAIHYHIMQLDNFGFLVLLKNKSLIDCEIILSLEDINKKLGQACEACIINSDLFIAKEKAEESERLKSAFLANVSHEIRTPLNGIIGFSELFVAENATGEKREYYANTIRAKGMQLLNIVNDIIDISRIESGIFNIFKEDINLSEFASGIYNQYKSIYKNSVVKFEFHPDTILDDAVIESDRLKLKQVLVNLLENAFKFTSTGSIVLGYRKISGHIEFFVNDTGIGVDEKSFKPIFKPFRQVELAHTRQYGGTGLGLSISKRIVEFLGGKMWLESELNIGSTFYFTLPYNS